jgi:LysR family transcriptional regulator, transcriptional activator of the cysJI operon
MLILRRPSSARMHIETLKTFCDLVESGSFNKAAELNLVSQSAVSQQLKALEERFGGRLLERGARRTVMLTETGRQVYAECKEIVARFRTLEERLRQPTSAVAGVVKLATVYSIGLHELPPYVTRFMRAHPQVKVHVEYSRTDRICQSCLDGTIDFGIVAFPLRRTNVVVLPWRREKLVLVCPPSHRLARRRRVPLAALSGEALVAFEPDIPTRKTIDRVLRSHGVAVRTAMEFDNIETIKRSVEVGSGVSILPESTIVNEVKSQQLVAVNLVEGPFFREVGVVHRRGQVLGAAARAFVETLGIQPGVST